MKSSEIRKKFIEYFNKNGHTTVKSSSLIPHDDPTLLFNNAGMNQFKNVFQGLEDLKFNRAVSSQKCVRAGGKHNDLENVGFTARHHTFFEMLGNFSFGDYFKKEAIHYAWHMLTEEFGLPKEKLYVTVFETDDEAYDIWLNQEKIPKDRIYRFGEKDNFWRMGKTGPCGPCSEIFYDFGDVMGGNPTDNVMGGEGDRYMEVWNLVFMQYLENEQGEQSPLPKRSIDTGCGLERFATVLQGKLNNYDTDVFSDIIATATRISGTKYLTGSKDKNQHNMNVALRVLADHSRTSAFLIGDGVTPSNEGRGYVLRRIMRRAIRYGHKLSENDSLLPNTTETVIEQMMGAYPELEKNKSLILKTCKDEEERFKKTLNQGTEILMSALDKLKSSKDKTLPGSISFKLYDTYGFPLDLTQVIASENGFNVNEGDFQKHMNEAKSKAKGSWKGSGFNELKTHLSEASKKIVDEHGKTQFTGYNYNLKETSKCVGLSDGKQATKELKKGDTGFIALAKTSFYAESGGQCGDTGIIESNSGKASVLDCKKNLDIHWLEIEVSEGTITESDELKQSVNHNKRLAIASNHSATHLLHAALRAVLGDHIRQAGSLVDADKLRFDFTHNKPMTFEEILKVEEAVNNEIFKSINTEKNEMPYDKAIESGALALFGEKYGDKVRVLKFSDFSTELCGGTHVNNTSMIHLFKVKQETGVSSGVRRIEALTGKSALNYLNSSHIENTSLQSKYLNKKQVAELKTVGDFVSFDKSILSKDSKDNSEINSYIGKLNNEISDLKKKLRSSQSNKVDIDQLINDAVDIKSDTKSYKMVWAQIEQDDRSALSDINDKLKNKIKSGVVVILGKGDSTHPIIIGVTKDLNKSIRAGDLLKHLSQDLGGKGGGRPDFAQGAYQNYDKLDAAKNTAVSYLSKI